MSRFDNAIRFVYPEWKPALAIPPLDGALIPNNHLDEATVLHDERGVVDAALLHGRLAVAVDRRIVFPDRPDATVELPGPVACIIVSRAGDLVAGVKGEGIWRVSTKGVVRQILSQVQGTRIVDPTAIAELEDGELVLTEGSVNHPDAWARDLLMKGASGRVIRSYADGSEARVVDSGLRYASGVCVSHDGACILVSEAWTHSVWRYSLSDPSGRPRTPVLRDLPGYPGHLAPRQDRGDYWLTMFALRTQLVEFVLQQDGFRREMMKSITPELWVRPALSTLNTGLEPLQAGQMKKLGITKPWAPPRSYGLLVRLAEDGEVRESWHSRAGGSNHGITGVIDAPDGAIVVSAGGGRVLEVVTQ